MVSDTNEAVPNTPLTGLQYKHPRLLGSMSNLRIVGGVVRVGFKRPGGRKGGWTRISHPQRQMKLRRAGRQSLRSYRASEKERHGLCNGEAFTPSGDIGSKASGPNQKGRGRVHKKPLSKINFSSLRKSSQKILHKKLSIFMQAVPSWFRHEEKNLHLRTG